MSGSGCGCGSCHEQFFRFLDHVTSEYSASDVYFHPPGEWALTRKLAVCTQQIKGQQQTMPTSEYK